MINICSNPTFNNTSSLKWENFFGKKQEVGCHINGYMTTTIKYIFLISWLAIYIYVTPASAQSKNTKAQKLFLSAQQAMHVQKFDKATQLLIEAINIDKNFVDAMQQLADIYRKQHKSVDALHYYKKVRELAPNLTPLTYYGLGESYLFTGHYKEALHSFEYYLQIGRYSQKSKNQIDKYIQDCLFSLNNISNKKHSEQIKLPKEINTSDDEYFPKLTADNNTIIFTRKVGNKESFYKSKKVNNKWEESTLLVGDINSNQFNEGSHCISLDGKYLFFAGCNRPDGLGSCDIYVSKKENDIWTAPHNLGTPINTRGWESQPAISADGRTLYFVSNRAGGYGGTDIWKSNLLDNGEWSQPVNLGPDINTPFDESAPYIHADNRTLYFASTGWPGFGQNDIFKSYLQDNGQWLIPENLGPEINSFTNQSAFHISLNGKVGHLSSEDMDGKKDIYEILLTQSSQAPAVAFIEGTIIDATTSKPLSAQIVVTNIQTGENVYQAVSDIIDGQFLTTLPIGKQYAIHIFKKGYIFNSKKYNLIDSITYADKYIENIQLEPIRSGISAVLENIYFDFDKSELLEESTLELQLLTHFLSTNPSIKIEIQGHTDNLGDSIYNQRLSEKRAESVRTYLLNKKINSNRIQIKGFGSTAPLASNDTLEGQQKNRRTSFVITDY